MLTVDPTTATIPEMVEYTFDAEVLDTDTPNQTLTFSLAGAPTGAMIDQATGAFTWTPSETDGPGDYTFKVLVTDGVAITEQSVTLTVSEVNRPPVVEPIEPQSGNEQETIIFNVRAVDHDLPPNALTWSVSDLPEGANFDDQTGMFAWTPDNGQDGLFDVTFTVTDDGTPPLNDSETVQITVIGVNDPPIAADDEYRVDEDGVLAVAAPGVLGNDRDPERNALAAVQLTVPSHGTLSFQTDGSFTYTPEANYFGPDGFTYQATDAGLVSNIARVSIIVEPVNDPPVANDDRYDVFAGIETVIEDPGVLANDVDPDSTLTPILVTGAAHGTAVFSSDGAFTYTSAGYFGPDSFAYRLFDGAAYSNVATVNLNVIPITTIIDDRDPGYSEPAGAWDTGGSMGLGSQYDYYEKDHRFTMFGTAQWDFENLAPLATYVVSATWTPYPNRTPKAQYKVIVDGVETTITLDQRKKPGDFDDPEPQDEVYGVAWQELATVTLPAGVTSVEVQVSNTVSAFLIADAMRIDRIFEREIELWEGGRLLKDGLSTVDFGTGLLGAPAMKEFTIVNRGPTSSPRRVP